MNFKEALSVVSVVSLFISAAFLVIKLLSAVLAIINTSTLIPIFIISLCVVVINVIRQK